MKIESKVPFTRYSYDDKLHWNFRRFPSPLIDFEVMKESNQLWLPQRLRNPEMNVFGLRGNSF